MASARKRAELIALAFRRYHRGEITLGDLCACIAEIRDNENPLI